MASCLSCSCRRFTTPDCTLLPSASAFATSPTSPSVWSCPRLPSPQSVDKAEASGRRQVEGAPIASASRAGSPHRTPTPDTIPFRRRIDFSSSEPAAGADGDPFQPDLDRPTPTPAYLRLIKKVRWLTSSAFWEDKQDCPSAECSEEVGGISRFISVSASRNPLREKGSGQGPPGWVTSYGQNRQCGVGYRGSASTT
ncbi:hypothetical protein ZEAMMB73_Zm00001d001871 [Zea mays]|uniref:Uncharacterized protein n=1 Tax=Zea mays TaxID=4577 RepID=A0A1D6DTS4_MAIZE|nr:hypothetical protein ZEAMMB73_Zm00001d001871 [Zea mays]